MRVHPLHAKHVAKRKRQSDSDSLDLRRSMDHVIEDDPDLNSAHW